MFERFTDQARKVMIHAEWAARDLSHQYIGTEHILLGLAMTDDTIAKNTLVALDIHEITIRAYIKEIIGQGNSAPIGHIPFSPRAKEVLEDGLREALQLGVNYIGPEHLLLGIIREGEGVAAQILVRMGVGLVTLRKEVIARIVAAHTSSSQSQKSSPSSPSTFPDTLDPATLSNDERFSAALSAFRHAQLDYLTTVTALEEMQREVKLQKEALGLIEGRLRDAEREFSQVIWEWAGTGIADVVMKQRGQGDGGDREDGRDEGDGD